MGKPIEKIDPISFPVNGVATAPPPNWLIYPNLSSHETTNKRAIQGTSQDQKPYTLSKPQLSPFSSMLTHHAEHTEKAFEKRKTVRLDEMESSIEKMETLEKERYLKIQEAIEAEATVSFWGILGDVTSTISGACSCLFGYSAYVGGAPLLGGALLSSGLLSMGQIAAKQMGLCDWLASQMPGDQEEYRTFFHTYIPASISIIGATSALYGNYGAGRYMAKTGMGKLAHILESISSFSSGATNFNLGISQAHLKNISATLSLIDSNFRFTRIALDKFIEDIQHLEKKEEKLSDLIATILKETNQAVQITQQPV